MELITKVVEVYGVETDREIQVSKSSGNFKVPFWLVDTVCHKLSHTLLFWKEAGGGAPHGGVRHATTHAGPRKVPGC